MKRKFIITPMNLSISKENPSNNNNSNNIIPIYSKYKHNQTTMNKFRNKISMNNQTVNENQNKQNGINHLQAGSFLCNKHNDNNNNINSNINQHPIKLFQANIVTPINKLKEEQRKLFNNFNSSIANVEHRHKIIKHFRSISANSSSNTNDNINSNDNIDNENYYSFYNISSPKIENLSNSSFSPSFRSLSYNTSNSYISFSPRNPIELEDLMKLHSSLNNIICSLNNGISPTLADLLDYWNALYLSSLLHNIQTLFRDTYNKTQIKLFSHLECLCVLISIDLSLNNEININSAVLSELKSIYGCIHFNFLLVIKYILTNYSTNNIKENGIRRSLLKAIEVGLSENISTEDMKEHYLMKLLKYNVDSIISGYKNIVEQCYLVPRCSVSNINLKKRNDIEQEYINGIISRFFIDAFNNIEDFSFEQSNSILNEQILKKENKACINNNNDLLQIETHSEANENNNINNITPHFQNNNIYNSRYSFGNKNNLNNSNNSTANKVSATHRKSQSETSITKYSINNEDNTNNKSKYTLQYSSRLSFNSESPFIIPSSNNNTNSYRQLNTGCLSTLIYYLPPINPTFKFTLVLDLDETLLRVTKINNKLSLYNNSSTTVKVIYRPHLFSFLSRMKKIYEIILFTVSLPEYANKIVNLIENKEKYFSYKLFRQHATFYQNKDYVKDISKLGRDLKRVIIIDDMPQNFSLQKENGISVKPFYGDNANDMTLSKLGSILERIRFDNEDVKGSEEIDVRKSIRKYKDKLNELVN